MAIVRYCIISNSTGVCSEVISWDNATTYYPPSGFVVAGDNTGEVGWTYSSGTSPGGTWTPESSSSFAASDPDPLPVDFGGTGATTAADARTNLGVPYSSTSSVLTGTATNSVVTPNALGALWELGSAIASAATISVGEGGLFKVTGTTTITDIDFAVDTPGRTVWLYFSGALTLTHNATTLILPGGADITTAAGDVACFASEGSDVARCLVYTRASGAALVGGSGGVNLQTFSSSGTWTKPSGAKMVYARIWGAGAGGASGQLAASSTSKSGGTGGGGGAYYDILIRADQLGATESVTVGAGGTGGAARTNTAGASIAGTNGGSSSFAGFTVSGGFALTVNSGEDNNEGVTLTPGLGTAIFPVRSSFNIGSGIYSYNDATIGGRGGRGSSSAGNPGHQSINSGGGGGSGGGEGSTNVLGAVGAGGNTGVAFPISDSSGPLNSAVGGGGAAGTSSAASPTNGANGAAFQGGGGGGSATTATNAGSGGNGGTAAGGGGGGTNRSGSATRSSGAGGDGGNGYVEVYAW